MSNPASWVNVLYVCMRICVWVLEKGVICSKRVAKAVVLHNQLQLRQCDEKSFYFLLSVHSWWQVYPPWKPTIVERENKWETTRLRQKKRCDTVNEDVECRIWNMCAAQKQDESSSRNAAVSNTMKLICGSRGICHPTINRVKWSKALDRKAFYSDWNHPLSCSRHSSHIRGMNRQNLYSTCETFESSEETDIYKMCESNVERKNRRFSWPVLPWSAEPGTCSSFPGSCLYSPVTWKAHWWWRTGDHSGCPATERSRDWHWGQGSC